ncbi:hypothetical protein ANN_09856 [Periplaneta americana]|uniref:Uncharacterized protein n=1 Tax=Periplaneta americana TaxID=6978 RepID=A0ABQ8TNG4_PERAM|nr:hypothetical protein ANN_09856 [Periplaneta americana]
MEIIEERFVGFSDVSNDRTAVRLAQNLFDRVEEFQCSEKLMAQTYDGAPSHVRSILTEESQNRTSIQVVYNITVPTKRSFTYVAMLIRKTADIGVPKYPICSMRNSFMTRNYDCVGEFPFEA